MTKTTAAVILGLAFLGWTTINGFADARKEDQAAKIQYVQTVCDIAHTSQTNGETEATCGSAQDQTNTEYLCNSVGTSCWVEAK